MKELQFMGNVQQLVNYKKGNELFEEDMIGLFFVIQEETISMEFPKDLEVDRVDILKDYVELLDEAIREKYQVFKFIQRKTCM